MVTPPASRLSRRAFLRFVAGATLSSALGWLYTTQLETRWLDIERLTLALPRLAPAFEGFTLAQLSDFHLGPVVSPDQIHAAVTATLALKPDAIVITGDFVTELDNGEPEQLVATLTPLTAPAGVYAVLGNHDHWTDAQTVATAVQRAGVTVLRNAQVALTRAGATLHLAGVDDYWERYADLSRALADVPRSAPTILLAHEPDYADLAARDPRVVLQLSGHSHGGQVRLPFIGAPLLPPLGRKYPLGLRQVGGMQVYTNRGIGVLSPPVRFNCRPEITLFTFTTA